MHCHNKPDFNKRVKALIKQTYDTTLKIPFIFNSDVQGTVDTLNGEVLNRMNELYYEELKEVLKAHVDSKIKVKDFFSNLVAVPVSVPVNVAVSVSVPKQQEKISFAGTGTEQEVVDHLIGKLKVSSSNPSTKLPLRLGQLSREPIVNKEPYYHPLQAQQAIADYRDMTG